MGRYVVPPSHFQYDVEDVHVPTETVMRNGRELLPQQTFDAKGFELRRWASSCKDFDSDLEVARTYYDEVRSLIQQASSASHVLVFDHVVRRVQGGSSDDSCVGLAAVDRVHCDYTPDSAKFRLEQIMDTGIYSVSRRQMLTHAEAKRLLDCRHAFINVWRNIDDEPVQRSPLAVCDPATVPIKDRFYYEIIYPAHVAREDENYSLRFNIAHEWYYYPSMLREECLLMKMYDTKDDEPQCVFHTAFDDPLSSVDAPARRSIEVRAVAFFDAEGVDGEMLQTKLRFKNGKIIGNQSPHE